MLVVEVEGIVISGKSTFITGLSAGGFIELVLVRIDGKNHKTAAIKTKITIIAPITAPIPLPSLFLLGSGLFITVVMLFFIKLVSY